MWRKIYFSNKFKSWNTEAFVGTINNATNSEVFNKFKNTKSEEK